MAAQSSGPSADIVDLWKRSEELVKLTTSNAPSLKTPTGPTALASDRSPIWANLTQLSPSDQARIMAQLATDWPFASERRALNWPIMGGIIANMVTSANICARINADMVLYDKRMSFFDSVRRGPKAPLVFGVYSSGVTLFAMHHIFISSALYAEGRPCSSCLLSTAVAVDITSGVIVPMLSTPYIAYYILLNRAGDKDKFPPMKNMLEVLSLCVEGSRAARPMLPYAIALQVAVATAGTYAALWGRSRLFDTLDADEELARKLMVQAQEKKGLKEKAMDWIASVPLLGGVVKETPPEQERLRVK